MKRSKFIVIAAPSGSGKTTIVNKLLNEKNLGLSFSISATSREPRKNEKDGENYFFISKEEFLRRVNNDEFVEWEEVYKGVFYGTLFSVVDGVSLANKGADFEQINPLIEQR